MKQHPFPTTRQPQRRHPRWCLVLFTCVMLLVVPLSAVQATPEQFNQAASELAQTDQVTTTAYLPLISNGETDTPPPPDPQAPRFEPGACPIAPPSGVEVTCGYLSVPESRQQDTNQRIKLAVMIVHATGNNPAPDPVVFLRGGPGGAAIEITDLLVQEYALLLEQRDLIVLDQRGAGLSIPSLSCPYPSFESGEQTVAANMGLTKAIQQADPIQEAVDALVACYTTLTAAGVDPSSYTSAENAADLADLQEALDYPSLNLLGSSYGTRLALTAMRDHPESIRSVVLDSVLPLQVTYQAETYGSFAQALQNLFDDCAADQACNATYPNLATTYDTLVATLNETPAEVPFTDPTTGEEFVFPMSGNLFGRYIFSWFYDTSIIPVLPRLISDTSAGDYTILVESFRSFARIATVNDGVFTSVQCSKDLPFVTVEDFRQSLAEHPRGAPLTESVLTNEAFLGVCDAWDLPAPDPIENEPVESSIDTLIVTGEYDPITPSQWGDLAAETLENSVVVPPYPRGGHTPTRSSDCLASIVTAFVNDPSEEPDVSCIAEEAPLPFVVDQDEARSIIEEAELTRLP